MEKSNKLIIYYFSGTGNSKNVARWISEIAVKKEISCEINNIAEIDRKNIATPSPDALLIFISPIHGFNYPPVMTGFISRFPKGKNNIVLMNTRAGMLIGNYNLPGLTGVAFLLFSFLLKVKGYSICGMVPFDLPSNWISLHPGLNDRTVKTLHSKNKEKVIECAEKILNGREEFKALREIIQDVLISPISLGYYFIGRFLFSKTFYTSKDCNDCEVCIIKCPVKAIIKVDNRPFWTFRCESCMNCMSICPKKSIQTGHGFIISILFLASFLTTVFFKYLNHIVNFNNPVINFIVDAFLTLIIIGISYRVIHFLMRFKLIERMMVYTSFTRYKFWGKRYRAIKDF